MLLPNTAHWLPLQKLAARHFFERVSVECRPICLSLWFWKLNILIAGDKSFIVSTPQRLEPSMKPSIFVTSASDCDRLLDVWQLKYAALPAALWLHRMTSRCPWLTFSPGTIVWKRFASRAALWAARRSPDLQKFRLTVGVNMIGRTCIYHLFQLAA